MSRHAIPRGGSCRVCGEFPVARVKCHVARLAWSAFWDDAVIYVPGIAQTQRRLPCQVIASMKV